MNDSAETHTHAHTRTKLQQDSNSIGFLGFQQPQSFHMGNGPFVKCVTTVETTLADMDASLELQTASRKGQKCSSVRAASQYVGLKKQTQKPTQESSSTLFGHLIQDTSFCGKNCQLLVNNPGGSHGHHCHRSPAQTASLLQGRNNEQQSHKNPFNLLQLRSKNHCKSCSFHDPAFRPTRVPDRSGAHDSGNKESVGSRNQVRSDFIRELQPPDPHTNYLQSIQHRLQIPALCSH